MNFLFTFLDLFFKVVTTDIISFSSLAAAQEFAARKVKFDPSVSAVQIESVKVLDRDFWITIEEVVGADDYVTTCIDSVNAAYFHSMEYIISTLIDGEHYGERQFTIYRFKEVMNKKIHDLAVDLENDFFQEGFDELSELLEGKEIYSCFGVCHLEDEEDCEEVDETRPQQFFIDDSGNKVIFPL